MEKTQNKKVMLQAQSLSDGIAKMEFSVLTDTGANPNDKKMYQHFFENMYKKMDTASGGLKGTQKFPAPYTIEFLLQYYFLTKDKRALNVATTTLTQMALGGIYDQVGSGFSRYAVDMIAEHGDTTPIDWLHRSQRYGEKLATPDVSVADLIGDIDPIKAANLKLSFADRLLGLRHRYQSGLLDFFPSLWRLNRPNLGGIRDRLGFRGLDR